MIIYSVTVSIERDIETDWLSWMRDVHIPEVLNAGFFRDHQVRRVVRPAAAGGWVTYSVEYSCASIDDYEAYQTNAAPGLQKAHSERFKDRFVTSRAVFEAVG